MVCVPSTHHEGRPLPPAVTVGGFGARKGKLGISEFPSNNSKRRRTASCLPSACLTVFSMAQWRSTIASINLVVLSTCTSMFCSTAVTRPLKPSISFLRDSHAKLLADETGSEECLPLPRPGLAFSPPVAPRHQKPLCCRAAGSVASPWM